MKRVLLLVALFSFVLALALPPMAAAESGADLYKSKCQGCHGPGGVPSAGMAKAMGMKPLGESAVQSMSDADLTATIENGKGKMKGFKGTLSDAQVKELVSYVRTLKK
ncbi:MAG: c-type cytochrome [Terriglobales bacterium]